MFAFGFGATIILTQMCGLGLSTWAKRGLAIGFLVIAVELQDSGVQISGFSPGMLTTDMLTNPNVVGERGKEMLKNFGFVLRFLGEPAKYAADKLVKTIESDNKKFAEVKLFKPWTPLLGLIQVGRENLSKTGKTPEFELHYQEAYQYKKK